MATDIAAGHLGLLSQRIFVTGANGFIAAYCTAELLRNGYQVVGTVRSAEKAYAVLKAHQHNPSLILEIVPDVTITTAFDKAIQGCHGVLHLASPFGYAINGTKAICLAATETPSVKRVVLTSSFAAAFDASAGPSSGKVYKDDDWSPLTYEDGKTATATLVAYRASKKLAEEAAWAFVKEKKPSWNLGILCPGMVFGLLFPGTLNSLKNLNASNQIVWGLADAEEVPVTKARLWTSVTTLAQAHVNALNIQEAGNERVLVINGSFDNQELADIVHESVRIPERVKERVPKGSPGSRLTGKIFTAGSSKDVSILGLDLNVSQESLSNTISDLVLQLANIETQS
ncbi:NAD(P)-binding protein [Mytilinidion resinicola]|uniref:NAD(P)-binding protein n=1 Tax=Mytilinidion resinicola TaxID=574789 RepID=A0A6A6YS71_9PEZI|nr:NAD(P)-binding protein [Mytilinidion resinicola]KAF2811398.1 NAD(P)-binding protein [Mytilinidion resinicola]